MGGLQRQIKADVGETESILQSETVRVAKKVTNVAWKSQDESAIRTGVTLLEIMVDATKN